MKAIAKVDLVAITPDEMEEFEREMTKRALRTSYRREEEISSHASFEEKSSSSERKA